MADFPTTPIIDDFNRANQGPPASANWSLGFAEELQGIEEPGHRVVSNQLANVGGDINQNWWNAEQFGPDCEAYITVVNATNVIAVGLAARLTNIDGFSSDGYYVQVNASGGGVNRTYQIIRIDGGTLTFLANDSEFDVGPMTGNKYGIKIVENTIQLWADLGDGWVVKLATEDATYTSAGFLGIVTECSSSLSCRWDDFGGGTIGGSYNPYRHKKRRGMMAFWRRFVR